MKVAACLFTVLLLTRPARAQKPELVTETGNTHPVFSVAFSGNGRILASAGGHDVIVLWDVATGRELRTLAGHNGEVISLAFAPHTQILASGSADGTVKLWDVTSGQQIRSLIGNAEWVNTVVNRVAFSPDGRTLASSNENGNLAPGSENDTIKLWDVASGREILTIRTGQQWVKALAFAPDGKTLASGSWDRTIKLWDTKTGVELLSLSGHSLAINSIAFSPDGRKLASGSEDETIRLWDVASGHQLRSLSGHDLSVESITFSPDGHTLASTAGHIVKLWDVATGGELRSLVAKQAGIGLSLAFSPDGRVLALGCYDKVVKLWDAASGDELRTLASHIEEVRSVAFSPDGHILASAGTDNTVKLWDTVGGRELRTLAGHTNWVLAVGFSPDGRILASGSLDGTVKLWDIASGRELRTLSAHIYEVDSVAFSPDGKILASGADETVRLWDVATGRKVRVLRGHTDLVNSVAFSPDGQILASGSDDDTCKLWDMTTGQELRTLAGHTKSVETVSFSRDGRTFASGSSDGTVKLWEVATGHELRSLLGHILTVRSVAFSPDGRTLASANTDGTVRLWETATGFELRALTGHTAAVLSVAFSPEGQFIASAAEDGSTRLWSASSGNQLATLFAIDKADWAVLDPVGRFDASSDGMRLMHWVVGSEPIDFDQLKDRYWDPGLLAKIFGFKKEPLRKVSILDRVALYPEIESNEAVDADGKLHIKLKNRGGGIGRVQVFVNGVELFRDARGPKPIPNVPEMVLTIDLSKGALRRGQQNEIRIIVRNAEGSLASRGLAITWKSPGTSNEGKPELYAIVSGVSEYAADELRLSFPAKDAEDMARALQLGGVRLFGPDHVHVNVLSSAGKTGELVPSKANLKRAFQAVRNAQPDDVFVVYFSGHGVTVGDIYAYPTREARTLDLSDPSTLEQTSITSEELAAWMNEVHALHKVMILDTCAAGAAARIIEPKGVPGDQVRALDGLKDRTGFHILMGSAANAQSYGASAYDQSLLTYALLQGMRGAALKNDVDVDVRTLFEYAVDQVPNLARGLGGIQKPEIFAPPEASTFDIGQLLPEDKKQIPLAQARPMILRPVLINLDDGTDNLSLMPAVRSELRDKTYTALRDEADAAAHRNPIALSPNYVDADELPGAIRPFGTYTVQGKLVSVKLVLTLDDKRASREVQGPADDRSALAAKIVTAILEACKTF